MELWASGFNAWGQLDFQDQSSTQYRDLKNFRCVYQDECIEILRTTLSATLSKLNTLLLHWTFFAPQGLYN